jgi:hypothetical protein
MTSSRTSRNPIIALILIACVALAGCTSGTPSPSAVAPSASAGASGTPSASESSSMPASASASAETSASESASAAPSEPTESLPPFACSPTVTVSATTDRAQITDVRVATHPTFDRIVYEFAGGVPQTVIEAVLPPFYRDPSGLPLPVAGTAFLKVTMTYGTKVSPDGGITYTGPTDFEPGFPQLRQLVEAGDFEAVSNWYIGLNGGGCIRALSLLDPSRLVIDIAH